MTGHDETRLPVQLGRVALRSFRGGQIALLLAVIAFVVGPLTGAMSLNVWLLAMGLFAAGVFQMRRAHNAPATDLVFVDGTVRADDPALPSTRIRLAGLDPARSAVADNSGGRQLVLVNADGASITAASTREDYPYNGVEPDPHETLRSVFDVLMGRAPETQPSAVFADGAAVELATCASCGSTVPPSADARVKCPYCSAEVALTDALRERVRASRELASQRTDQDAAVRALLVQPPSHAVRRRIVTAALITGGTWLAVLVAFGIDWAIATSPAVQFVHLVVLIGVGFAVSEGVLLLVRAQVGQRLTLRALAFGFAPRAPRVPGTPPCCRTCGAPLDVPAESSVARCAYCRAENVIGLAMTGLAARVRAEVASLQDVLREHEIAQKRARTGTRAGIVALLGAAVVAAVVGISFDLAVRRQDARCQHGDGASCAALAQRYQRGDGVIASRDRAVELATRACGLNAAAGCDLAFALLDDRTRPDWNLLAPLALVAPACERGVDAVCDSAVARATTILETPSAAGRPVAVALLTHQCAAQDDASCTALLAHGVDVRGTVRDLDHAVDLAVGACGDSPQACAIRDALCAEHPRPTCPH